MEYKNMMIIHLGELRLSKADISKLGKHELAFLATMAHAVNEVSVFQKLFVQASAVKPQDDDLKLMSAIQLNAISRVLDAKIFEAIGMFEKQVKRLKRLKDVAALAALDQFVSRLAELKQHSGFELAEALRNTATNHYIPAEVEKNIDFVAPHASYCAYLHENQGNSFYPFGEELVFIGRIARYFHDKNGKPFEIRDLQALNDWSIQASRLLSGMLSTYMLWLYRTRFPGWMLKKRTPYLELELCSNLGYDALPIFHSADQFLSRQKSR